MHLPFAPRLAAPLVGVADRLLRRTVRWEVVDREAGLALARGGEVRIFACRHGQLWPLLWVVEDVGLSVVVSRSGDGDLLATLLRRRGFGVIRGSTTRDGSAAARGALRTLRAGGSIGVAVDGPRGPRGQVQDGVLRIAQRAAVPIVPLRAEGQRSWVARGSWDHFEVPRPGQRMRLVVGSPIVVAPGAEGLQTAGDALALALGGWRAGARPDGAESAWNDAATEIHGNLG